MSPSPPPIIRLQNVWKRLGDRDVLRGMSFEVRAGETFVIMGGSGGGKSVTLKHMIGVLQPDSGSVIVDGTEVPKLDRMGLMTLRKRIGYLFQSGALINWMTVFDNVALPLKENTKLTPHEIRGRVMDALQMVEMEHAAEQLPGGISGGMKKRAGLARALVTDPRIILYDEPNAGLDPVMSDTVNRIILSVQQKLGVTSVVVTHRRACAMTVGDRIALIERGQVTTQGTISEMRHSEHPMARQFLAASVD
ncbi:MAG: ABC transporter ATP-binding protein [Planctomycetota bacterium]|nr:MAG: ABC transporter ATP-binding protein [Planctomycetota bacterium]